MPVQKICTIIHVAALPSTGGDHLITRESTDLKGEEWAWPCLVVADPVVQAVHVGMCQMGIEWLACTAAYAGTCSCSSCCKVAVLKQNR